MIPVQKLDDLIQRGQMPVFIPNYYRGAYRQIPRTAGRSSQLFSTGTVQWVYRCLVDGLFGLKGSKEGLEINPQLPEDWQEASVKRAFRGAEFNISFKREAGIKAKEVYVNGELMVDDVIKNVETGKVYDVLVKIP